MTDYISRAEAVKAVSNYLREIHPTTSINFLEKAYGILNTVPSADAESHDAINEMNKEIIKDILKIIPTAYLLEALGVSTFEELTEPADRPHGEWIRQDKYFQAFNETVTTYKCSVCGHEPYFGGDISKLNFCPNCGSEMK